MTTLLVVGPRSPAIGGGVSSVDALVDYIRDRTAIRPIELNTASANGGPTVLLRMETLRRAFAISLEFYQKTKECDAVLLYASNPFILTLMPVLLVWTRVRRVPCFLKPLGGDLGLYLETLPRGFRKYVQWLLRRVDGLFPQTEEVTDALRSIGCERVFHVPGYRKPPSHHQARRGKGTGLRLIFLSHVRREKGPMVLLEALCLLREWGLKGVTCDFYGPIFADLQEEFLAELDTVPGACYRGPLPACESGAEVISRYEALVLPSYYVGEGHPGVIIEAMLAGAPIVATRQGGIAEIVDHEENGLLVPRRDGVALAKALERLARDHSLWERLAASSRAKGAQFRADVVVPKMLGRIQHWSAQNPSRSAQVRIPKVFTQSGGLDAPRRQQRQEARARKNS